MAMENPRWRIQKIIMNKINGDGKSAVAIPDGKSRNEKKKSHSPGEINIFSNLDTISISLWTRLRHHFLVLSVIN